MTYSTACDSYYTAGWAGVIPVPPGTKYPPPDGFTGDEGQDPTPVHIVLWATGDYRDHSVALRMPDGVIGIDVDQYLKKGTQKNGAATLAEKEREWGPLPPTWASTARGDDAGPGPSRTLFFRVPPGRYAGVLGPDVEILQRHHRYAVVAPSVNPETGTRYRWYRPDGTPAPDKAVPSPADLAVLPESWAAGLAEDASDPAPRSAGRGAGRELLDAITASAGLRCARMAGALSKTLASAEAAAPGSRHDLMTEAVYNVIMLAAEGHPGAAGTLDELDAEWRRLTSGEGRAGEFGNMLLTAARKAVTKYGTRLLDQDPCTGMFGFTYQAPSPGTPGGTEGQAPVAAPRQWSPYLVIGTQVFDPPGMSDALLARDVLARMQPALRFCPDNGAWIVRGPEHWEVNRNELGRWAAEVMHPLMPPGDPEADPNTAPGKILVDQAKRKAKFTANASSNAIAGKMNAQVMAGYHPCAVNLADLDQDHEVLWAGGMAYDLRASANGPAFARLDPGIPHIHSAGTVPEKRPTPLWDSFLAAVWPDPEVRRWALRVLSVAFTGYADKVMPILLGHSDRGKTSVITLLMSVLGSYAHAADPRLLAPADKSHASIVYALKGRRMSFIDEAPRRGMQAQERLKQLTGGAELTGNQMRENPVTFRPTHTLILTANYEYEPDLTDGAVRNRTRLIPCDGDPDEVRAARAAIGPLDGPAWREEAPGVLALMMAHAAHYLADPSSASTGKGPLQVQAAADALVSTQDQILSWVMDECEPYETGTASRQLYIAFRNSCLQLRGPQAPVPSETMWGLRLTDLGYPSRHTRTGKTRALKLRQPGSADPWQNGDEPGNGFFVTLRKDEDFLFNPSHPSRSPGTVTGDPVTGSTRHPAPVTDMPKSTSTPGNHLVTVSITDGEGYRERDGLISLVTGSLVPVTQPVTGSDLGFYGVVTGVTGSSHIQHVRSNVTDQYTEYMEEIGKGGHAVTPSQIPVSSSPEVTATQAEQVTVLPVTPLLPVTRRTVIFDLETASADELFTRKPEDPAFVRLAGAQGPDGVPRIADAATLLAELERAPSITGHNILGFDLVALAVHHGADYTRLAAKATDTEILARQHFPPRSRESGTSEDKYDLDHVAELLGVPGKSDSAMRLQRKHGGWDKIPLDDPEYRAYLEGDLSATAAVAARLPRDAYTDREHRVAAIAGQMTISGFRVDVPLLEERYAAGQRRKRDALELLHDAFGLPLGRTVLRGRGKARHEEFEELDAPLAGDSGRAWLAGIWERYGIANPPRTAKAGKLSVGADDLRQVAADPRCPAQLRDIIGLIGIIVGTRTVYQTARDHLCPDGRVHPKNSFRQASGRWSVTAPGLTVFGKRDGKHVERDIFLPEEGHVLISADLSQVDMRAMAWLSGDHGYRALFAPGKDAHQEIAGQVGVSRQDAKAIGHGWNYGLGAKRMIASGLDPEKVHAFIAGMEARFPRLIAWREQIRERGKAGEILDNGWGRRMRCAPERAYTVAPALMGQGCARDIMAQCLLRLPPAVIPMLRAFVHDEVLLSADKDSAVMVAQEVKKAMTWPLDDDIWVTCDMNFGTSWGECSAH